MIRLLTGECIMKKSGKTQDENQKCSFVLARLMLVVIPALKSALIWEIQNDTGQMVYSRDLWPLYIAVLVAWVITFLAYIISSKAKWKPLYIRLFNVTQWILYVILLIIICAELVVGRTR